MSSGKDINSQNVFFQIFALFSKAKKERRKWDTNHKKKYCSNLIWDTWGPQGWGKIVFISNLMCHK